MRRISVRSIFVPSLFALTAAFCLPVASHAQTSPTKSDSLASGTQRSKIPSKKISAKASSQSSYGSIPLQFEENRGQTDSQVQYIARGGGYTVFLTPSEAVFALKPGRPVSRGKKKMGRFTRPEQTGPQKLSILRMKLSGANASPVALPSSKLPGTVNYFVGHDSRKWRTGISTYSKIQYLDVYSGIDLVYYGQQNKLEYDFVVYPGADPQKIAFSFEGASPHGCSRELERTQTILPFIGNKAMQT